jgi:heme A synthase
MNAAATLLAPAVDAPLAGCRRARWLHGWAILTVGVTFVAFLTGAVVTTFRVGMADPVWPTYPWHLLLISWQEPSPGFLIEHTHRLADYTLGCCVIVLALGLRFAERRLWLQRLGLLALAGVVVQGILGGARVKLNALVGTDLAFVHGCFAQLVFTLLAGIAMFTAPTWDATRPDIAATEAIRLRTGAILLATVSYAQIVFGGLVRHTNSLLGQRAHFLAAFAVLAALAWMLHLAATNRNAWAYLRGGLITITVLMALQILLGVEAWMSKFGAGRNPSLDPITPGAGAVRTAHFFIGSLIFATAVVGALKASRLADRASVSPSARLSEAAS